jgi:predicted permease
VPAPEQLVNLTSPGPKEGRTSTSGTARAADVFSYPLFRDLERDQRALVGVAAHRDFAANVTYGGHASNEEGRLISGSYFSVLQLKPAAGRLIGPEDDREGGSHNVAVLSHGYWLSRFGGRPSVVNETVLVNGQSLTIVGVIPSGYLGTTLEARPQFYVPLSAASQMIPGWDGFDDRRDHWLYVFGRLKPDVRRDRAEAVMNSLFAGFLRDVELPAQRPRAETREEFLRRRLILEPGHQGQRPEREELAPIFKLLFSVTGVVLLIACANVAGLFLVRTIHRLPEVTVRMSLGASRSRLVRHFLTESGVISLMGTLGGVLVAVWTLDALTSLAPQAAAYFRFEVDSSLFLFAGSVALIVAMLIGVYPAFHGTRLDLASTLRTATTPRSTTRLRTALATTQIALAMGLLVVATLLVKSLLNVGRVDLGIEAERLTTFRVSPESVACRS